MKASTCSPRSWPGGYGCAGVITGFSFAPASVKDQALAEDFFAFRHTPHPRLPTLGNPARGWYVADKGFAGRELQKQWRNCYGARIIYPPQRNSRQPWPKQLRQWLAGMRQIVETVFGRLHHDFALDRERPHLLEGFQTRLAARTVLHNFCIRFNRQLGRPSPPVVAGGLWLAFASLLGW